MKTIKFYHVLILSIILTGLNLSFAQEDVEKTFTVSRGDRLQVSSSFGNNLVVDFLILVNNFTTHTKYRRSL